jgi:hypothetical protein
MLVELLRSFLSSLVSALAMNSRRTDSLVMTPSGLAVSFLASGAAKGGLSDFCWFAMSKPENVPNQHKMYQMVIKFPQCP